MILKQDTEVLNQREDCALMPSQEAPRSTVLLRQFLEDPNNRDVFGKFAAKYQPRIKQCCLRRGLQDADAEDLTAGILLRFCVRDVFDGFVFQSKAKFNNWLATVVKHDILAFLRGRKRKPDAWSLGNADIQESLEQVSDDMVHDMEATCEEDRARVEAAQARVKERVEEKTWQAFWLVVYEECAVENATEKLAMSKVAVWQAISRIKRMLREELRNLHDPSGTQ